MLTESPNIHPTFTQHWTSERVPAGPDASTRCCGKHLVGPRLPDRAGRIGTDGDDPEGPRNAQVRGSSPLSGSDRISPRKILCELTFGPTRELRRCPSGDAGTGTGEASAFSLVRG
jgi:hypothetical protein